MKIWGIFAGTVAAVFSLSDAPTSAAPIGLRIVGIEIAGRAVQGAPSFHLRNPGLDGGCSQVSVGCTLTQGMQVTVPKGDVVEVVSTTGKSRQKISGETLRVDQVSSSGEQYGVTPGGTSSATVTPGVLDFFRIVLTVDAVRFVAAVKGTEFVIDGSTQGKLTFRCVRGTVDIAKSGYIEIGGQRKPITLSDVISAKDRPQKTYEPSSNWYLTPAFADYPAAQEFFEAQLAQERAGGARDSIVAALRNLANVQLAQGLYPTALDSYQQALALYRQLGDRDGEAGALASIGVVQESLSEYSAAMQSDQQALALFRELGDRDGEASVLNNIGILQRHQGQDQYPAALQSYRQSLALVRELGDREGEANALVNIGDVQRDQDLLPAALQSEQQALAIFRELGDRDGEASALTGIGTVEYRQGPRQRPAALQAFEQALALFRELGDRSGEAGALGDVGIVQESQGDTTAALQSYEQARALFHELGDRDGEAAALNDIGLTQEATRQYPAALQSYQQALSMYEAIGEHGINVDHTQNNIARVKARLSAPSSPSPQPSVSP